MNIRLKIFFLLAIAIALPINASAAPVKSISLEVFKDGAERFWEVSVNCEALDQPRLMRRPVDRDQWCSHDIKNLCDKNKFSLSRQLCDDNFSKQIVNFRAGKPVNNAKIDAVVAKAAEKPVQTTTKVAKAEIKQSKPAPIKAQNTNVAFNQIENREDLLKEKIQIEEQRILIQQKRLELRRRELALQKRQLNAS